MSPVPSGNAILQTPSPLSITATGIAAPSPTSISQKGEALRSPLPSPTSTITATAGVTALLAQSLTQPLSTTSPVAAVTLYSYTLYSYTVVKTYPHDPTAFTEGLLFDNGVLYESTGLNGKSWLRQVNLETGQVLQQIDLPAQYFGEGITIFGDKIYQLTWQSHIGFIYNKTTFKSLKTFTYPTEGWGMTQDGQRLIMSDGTARLTFRNPETFAEIGHIDVHDANGPITQLNELEYVNGKIYANVWMTDWIVIIAPDTGQVTGWIDLKGLLPQADRAGADVLNGIAYLPQSDQLFVTGKQWPKLFEIRLAPKP
ncbi:MAG: glutaminyl-peptide cyclotransferase [Chloroflexi bacterium]|nr:glutaminyl-peptide cyclotransferase [Chloroflexota bacterium]